MANTSLNILITATDKASKALASINGQLQTLSKAGKVMMGVGVGLGAAMLKVTNNYSKAGDEVAKMAKRTGWATTSLSELRHVANLSDLSLDGLETGLKRMSSTILDAEDGLSTAVRAFDRLGVSVDDLKGMGPEEQFWTIANAIAGIEDPTLKAALAVDIFGRSGTDMLPMLAEGSEGIDAMRQEAHDLNLVFDEESAKAAEAFEDNKTRLVGALTGLGNAIATEVMPDIEKLVNKLTEAVKATSEWVKAHPELVGAIKSLIPVLIGAGGLFVALGQISKAIIGINTALTIMQALSGPKGWIVLGASVGIAALALKGMSKLMSGETPSATESEYQIGTDEWIAQQRAAGTMPSMASGGVVPGPIGEPVPIIAHGGEVFAGVGGGFGTNVTLNVYGSVMTESDLVDRFREALLKLKGRNVTTGL